MDPEMPLLLGENPLFVNNPLFFGEGWGECGTFEIDEGMGWGEG